jgi:hypothetical protein
MHTMSRRPATLFRAGDRTRARRRALAPVCVHASLNVSNLLRLRGRRARNRCVPLSVSGAAPALTHTRPELHL